MTNKDYETDNSMFECNDEADFQSFIEEREQASEWTEVTVREMKIEAATAFSFSIVFEGIFSTFINARLNLHKKRCFYDRIKGCQQDL